MGALDVSSNLVGLAVAGPGAYARAGLLRAQSRDDERLMIFDDRGALRPPPIRPLTRIAAPESVSFQYAFCLMKPEPSSIVPARFEHRARESAHAAR